MLDFETLSIDENIFLMEHSMYSLKNNVRQK